jgi:16S rRNA (guanine527-N7)-methyltransferase
MGTTFEGLGSDVKTEWSEAFHLDATAWERLEVHREALATAPLNLSRLYGERYWRYGVGDALSILELTDDWGRMVDIGSGAGFPGMILAIARPERVVVLVEARVKRAAFLENMATHLGLRHVKVVPKRAEEWLREDQLARGHFDLATARAIGSLRMAAELTLPALRKGGMAVWPRGSDAAEALQTDATFVRSLGGDGGRVHRSAGGLLLGVMKVRETPEEFPRARRPGR